MGKKCLICEGEAIYSIKGSSEYYCEACAEENFSDTELLQKLDEKPENAAEKVLDQLEEQEEKTDQ